MEESPVTKAIEGLEKKLVGSEEERKTNLFGSSGTTNQNDGLENDKDPSNRTEANDNNNADYTNMNQTPQELTYFVGIQSLLSERPKNLNIKYTILYYSASWCGPCRQFTPQLVNWYKKMKIANPQMEIVLVSRDRTQSDYEAYAKEMPWPKIAFEQKDNPLFNEHSPPGIPFLVMLDKNGNALTPKSHPTEVIPQIEALLSGRSTAREGQNNSSGGFKSSIFQ